MKTKTSENGAPSEPELTRKDFVSSQEVRWCPGCGDYVILATMQKAFAKLYRKKENVVCISGIGCSSRLPYYMDTYGVHSIHGRAPAVATGMKLANPELSVWVITGDGDSMAIGGNHLIHAARRNVDLNIIIFNNKIYGMTKGQSSPTTPLGYKTKTAPRGNYEAPFNIGQLAIGAGATFFARVPDNDPRLMEEVLIQAHEHKGTSIIEVLQNCVIFSNHIHEQITGRDTRDENQLVLEHGKPMIFGKEKKFGLRIDGMRLKKVPVNDETGNNPELLVHDARLDDPEVHIALSRLHLPDFPVAMGIIRQVEASPYEIDVYHAIAEAEKTGRYNSVTDLFHSGNTWEIS